MNRILVVGDVVDDIVVRPLSDVTSASDTNAEIRMYAGGSAANVAAWLGHAGADVRFLGRVGADGVERHIYALRTHGVDARIAGDPVAQTATIVLTLDGAGERTMFVDRGANGGLCADDVPEDAFDGVTWLHLTGYSFFDPRVRPTAFTLIETARERGVGVSIDPSSVGFLKGCGAAVFLDWIDGVDLCMPNLVEGQFLAGEFSPETVIANLGTRFPHVALKIGESGSLHTANSGGTVSQLAVDTAVVDTTGAGDAFAAGFLKVWVAERDGALALQAGATYAAQAVSTMGARPKP